MNRAVITGIGFVSPFGRGDAPAIEALRNGRSAIRQIASIDTSRLNCRIAGEVPADVFDAGQRTHDRFTRLALMAAEDAMRGAGAPAVDPDRFGVLIGTGLGGCETLDAGYRRFYSENARVPPMAIPLSMYNAASSAVSARFDARGPGFSVVSACASSAHAMGLALQAIRTGQADAMLVGGSDAPLTPGIISAWESLRVLAIDNENPAAACRPFSGERRGLVLAEGAAVFFVESLEHAERRGVRPLAEITGAAATSDAGHVTDPSAEGAARAMRLALADAKLNPGDVDYINAHGTGTRANDATEATAIRWIFGDQTPPVSSTKSMHGHAMGASGAIEVACSILALRAGFLPPTINLDNPDPLCAVNHIANVARDARARNFLSNSFGFGGMNAVVAIHLLDDR